MGFVIGGFLGLAILIGAIWLTIFLFLQTKERIRCERERRELERERLLLVEGEPLRCHGCGSVFAGPISNIGCEKCHSSVLVMPERQTATNDARSRKVENRR